MTNSTHTQRGSVGTSIMRVALGFTVFFTWLGNVDKKFYDGDNLPGFFDWAFKPVEEGGNGASLGFVQSMLDGTLLQAPEFFGWVLTFFELSLAVGLLFGICTRAVSLAALAFFTSLFLVYFGGEEWIWLYVLLMAGAINVFLSWGGRKWGVDEWLAESRGESPATLIW